MVIDLFCVCAVQDPHEFAYHRLKYDGPTRNVEWRSLFTARGDGLARGGEEFERAIRAADRPVVCGFNLPQTFSVMRGFVDPIEGIETIDMSTFAMMLILSSGELGGEIPITLESTCEMLGIPFTPGNAADGAYSIMKLFMAFADARPDA